MNGSTRGPLHSDTSSSDAFSQEVQAYPASASAAPSVAERWLVVLSSNQGLLGAFLEAGERLGRTALGFCAARNLDRFLTRCAARASVRVVIDLDMATEDGLQVLRSLATARCQLDVVLVSDKGARVLQAVRRVSDQRGLAVACTVGKPLSARAIEEALRCTSTTNRRIANAERPAIDGHDLQAAIQSRQLRVHYQPVLDLASGHVAAFEALVRWQHPTQGLVCPNQFIAIAERSGLVNELLAEVLRLGLEWLTRAASFPTLELSINLSARNLDGQFLCTLLDRLRAKWGIEPERITLELTETAALRNPIEAADVLTRLRLKGYRLALDDFGTGFSSLLQLSRLPFTEIKIDKAFICSMRTCADARDIVEAIVGLGSKLGLTTVAEGIENADSLTAMKALACDRAQGYYIGRPMDADAALAWLQSRMRATPAAGERAELHQVQAGNGLTSLGQEHTYTRHVGPEGVDIEPAAAQGRADKSAHQSAIDAFERAQRKYLAEENARLKQMLGERELEIDRLSQVRLRRRLGVADGPVE